MVEEESKAGDKVLLEDLKGGEEKGGEEKKETSKTLLPDVDVSNLDLLMGKMDEFCDKRTMIEQDKITYEKMKSEGKDPKDSFRVTGITEKGDDSAELNIITSGEKGDESAKETLSSLKRYKHVSVKSETSERYEKERPESCEEFGKWILRTLDSHALEYRARGELERAEDLEASARNIREKCMGEKIEEREKESEK